MNSIFFSYLFILVILFSGNNKIANAPVRFTGNKIETLEEKANIAYNTLDLNNYNIPQYQSFTEGFEGFFILKEKGKFKKEILTIIDFSLPSSAKRLWVIDLVSNKILFNTYVSHGSGSGENYAHRFSNTASSNKSSLGFYETAEVYNGKHGLSLKLDGLEKGLNSNARSRGIVFHGADYAGSWILNSQHYLGRSQGCPALPLIWCNQIINSIKNKSCLFIYHPSRSNSVTNKSLLMSQSAI
jgi:hypothetical protein